MLHQAEIAALRRALSEPDFRSAFKAFLEERARDATSKCKEYLLGDSRNVELASRWACFAAAYEETFAELEVFIEEQLGKSS